MSAATTTTPSNYAAIWNLNPQSTAIPKTESSFPLGAKGTESVIGKDNRSKTLSTDYADGGKYRAIIKLFIRYEKQPNDGNWGMATGWLIAPDMLVTAGHVAYDFGPTTQYGKAVIVKAYMGYSGAVNLTPTNLGSVNGAPPAVQLQYGTTFITTTGWLQSGGQAERADVSFLKLSGPFTGNFKPFSFVDTPLSAPATSPVTIGVVGYPADEKNTEGEEGAEMYQSFLLTSWNLDTDFGNLLTYTMSTYPGQSGSPVIRSSDGVVVGVHVLGGTAVNSASDINTKYGNQFGSFISAFTENDTPIGSILNVNIIKPMTVGPDTLNLTNIVHTTSSSTESSLGPTTTPTVTVSGNTEGFLDVLKDIGKVALPIISTGLNIASPFLGPLGAPAAAIGGVALGALSQACESAFNTTTESFQPASPPNADALNGIAQRAILAESALQATLKLDSTTPQGQQILTQMANTYATLKPLQNLHSKLFPAIAGPAIRIALNDTLPAPATESSISVRKPLPGAAAVESSFGAGTLVNPAFATALLQPTVLVPGQEGFFDDLGSIISTGLQYAAPIISAVAQAGVESALTASSGTESSLEATTPDSVISAPLFQRALVAECALQAVQSIDTPTLTALPLYDEAGNLETEGFFDFVKTTMQTIGSQILAVAPDVIKNVGPIAINLVANAIQSASGGGSGTEGNLPPSSGALTAPPVSIAALADSRAGTPIPAAQLSVSTLSSVVATSTSAVALPHAGSTAPVETRKAAMKTTGFHNLDGLIFRPAPWKGNADHPKQ